MPRRPSEAAVPAIRQKITSSSRCSQGQLPLSMPGERGRGQRRRRRRAIVPIGGTSGPSPARQATPESIAPTPIVTAAGGEPAAVPSASIAATGMAAMSPARAETCGAIEAARLPERVADRDRPAGGAGVANAAHANGGLGMYGCSGPTAPRVPIAP